MESFRLICIQVVLFIVLVIIGFPVISNTVPYIATFASESNQEQDKNKRSEEMEYLSKVVVILKEVLKYGSNIR